jgi:hypothetical protein
MAVACKSVAVAWQMAEFLQQNLTPLSAMSDISKDYDPTQFIRLGAKNELSYCHGRTKIGFDFRGGNEKVSRFMVAVLSWVAIRVGQKKLFRAVDTSGFPTVSARFPFIDYDGCESWPVLVREEFTLGAAAAKALRMPFVDKYGVGPKSRFMRAELVRLDSLWEAEAEVHRVLGRS